MVDLKAQDALNRAPPHVIRRHFLGEAMVKHLLQYVEANIEEFAANTVGQKEKLNQSINVSSSLKKIGNFRHEIEAVISEVLPDVFIRLGTVPFAPSSFEMLISAYGHSDFYKRHVDSHVGGVSESDRLITLVYYFHALPKAFSGGVLRIHSLAASGREGSFVDIEPVSDTAVFFPSWFPHEVLTVTCPSGSFMDSRFAITCMIHKHREK